MFNKKKIKELEAKLDAYKELTDKYQRALEERETRIRQFHNWSSGIIPIHVTYTITDSDINRYNVSQIPKVAKERLASAVASALKKSMDPTPLYDDSGEILCYEYDLEVRERISVDESDMIGDPGHNDYDEIW